MTMIKILLKSYYIFSGVRIHDNKETLNEDFEMENLLVY